MSKSTKSTVVLGIMPVDVETDLKKMEEEVRKIEMDGLTWQKAELKDVAFGLKKLVIQCMLIDEKVSMDELEEKLLGIKDYVQSVEVISWNKI